MSLKIRPLIYLLALWKKNLIFSLAMALLMSGVVLFQSRSSREIGLEDVLGFLKLIGFFFIFINFLFACIFLAMIAVSKSSAIAFRKTIRLKRFFSF